MPSPFPGMNPYLEHPGDWENFHHRFLVLTAMALKPPLASEYRIAVEEHVYITDHPPMNGVERLAGKADMAVVGTRAGVAVVSERKAPAIGTIPMPVEYQQLFLTIHHRKRRVVVTVMELLSPANKAAGGSHAKYLEKRANVLCSSAHLVEIDLLRGGQRPPIGGLPRCDYYVAVSRAGQRPLAELWPIRLRDRLPVIPIPLSDGRPDVMLDLQDLLHQAYDSGTFEDDIYDCQPQPRLSRADAAWAKQFLPNKPTSP